MSGRNIDLNLLRIFDVVMAERSITAAAGQLHLTQPAVSNAIRRLRHILKDELFLRSPGGVAPTAKAETIWPGIREALQNITDVVGLREFDPVTATVSFKLAMSDYVAHTIIRPLASDLCRIAPKVRINLTPYTIDNATEMLENASIDMAAGVYAHVGPRIQTAPLQTISYTCIMSSNNKLARHPLGEKEFLNARHVVVSLSGSKSLIDRNLENPSQKEKFVSRNIVLTVNQFAIVPQIVAESDLIAIVPLSTVRDSPHREALHVVASPIPIKPNIASLLWHERTNRSPTHAWLRGEIIRRSRQIE